MRASEASEPRPRSGVGVPARGRAGGPRGEAPGLRGERASEASEPRPRSGVGVPARGRAWGPRGEAPGLSEMTGNDFAVRLTRALGDDRVARDAPLAPFTTFKLGGTADWLVLAP